MRWSKRQRHLRPVVDDPFRAAEDVEFAVDVLVDLVEAVPAVRAERMPALAVLAAPATPTDYLLPLQLT